jgi:uncharacterized membrane protein YeaQ/YmgE (transglycosylase-associated protein family)
MQWEWCGVVVTGRRRTSHEFRNVVTWVLLGALAGVLAGLVMKRGGYGLKNDIILGLVGSIGAGWIFRAVGVLPEAGIVATAFVAFIGAAILVVAQRMVRPTERPSEEKGAIWRWGLGPRSWQPWCG